MAVYKTYAYIVIKSFCRKAVSLLKRRFRCSNKLQLTTFLQKQKIFFKKRCFFPIVWMNGPLPVLLITPVNSILKSGHQFIAVTNNASTTMIKMQMCENYVSNII